MSIKLRCYRQKISDEANDYLMVVASLSKGDRGSVNIHDTGVRIRYGKDTQTIPMIGVERLSYEPKSQTNTEHKKIKWEPSTTVPYLRLSPGEAAEFSCYCKVPRNEVCTIEVAFIGKRLTSRKMGQWRASRVSLPS